MTNPPKSFDTEAGFAVYTCETEDDWDKDIDISSDIIRMSPNLQLTVGRHHTIRFNLHNHAGKYTDPDSPFRITRNQKVVVSYLSKDYKFVVKSDPTTLKTGVVQINADSHSKQLLDSIVQIRVPLGIDGTQTVEDTIWLALYDNGYHNHFQLVMPDGENYYTWKSQTDTVPLTSDTRIYMNVAFNDFISDICNKHGLSWYEQPTTDTIRDEIVLYKLLDDHEVTEENTLYISNYRDGIDIQSNKSYDSIVNVVHISNYTNLTAPESILKYGRKKPMVIEAPDDISYEELVQYARKFLEQARYPEIQAKCTIHGFAEPFAQYIKIVDEDGNYDERLTIDRRLRVVSTIVMPHQGTMVLNAGNRERNWRMEHYKSLITSKSTETSMQAQNIIKGSSLKLHAYTEKDMLYTPVDTSGSGLYGTRIGIDSFYDNDGTDDESTYMWMDSDGVRGGTDPPPAPPPGPPAGPASYSEDIEYNVATLGDGYMSPYANQRGACKRSDDRVFYLFQNTYSSTDNLWLYYADGPDYDSWTSARITSDTGGGADMKSDWGMDMDSSGYLHIVYKGMSASPASTWIVWYMQYNTNTSTVSINPTEVAYYNTSNDQLYPTIVCDSSDVGHITWAGKGWGTNSGYYQIHYTNTDERTSDWPFTSSNPPNDSLTDIASSNSRPAIDIDSDDYIYVFWIGRNAILTNDTTDNVLWRKYTGSWGTVQKACDSSTATDGMHMVVDRYDDAMHIVIRRSTNGYWNRYDQDGSSWDGEEAAFTQGSTVSLEQIITQDYGQVPVILYNDGFSSVDEAIFRIKQSGTTWTTFDLDMGPDTRQQPYGAGKSFVYPQQGQPFNSASEGPEICFDWLDDDPSSTTWHQYYKNWTET